MSQKVITSQKLWDKHRNHQFGWWYILGNLTVILDVEIKKGTERINSKKLIKKMYYCVLVCVYKNNY